MEKRTLTSNVRAKIICLFLAIGLWIYINNIENPLVSQNIYKVPVEILNTSSLKELGFALAPNQNPTANIKVQGTTQVINSITKNDFKLAVDLKDYGMKKGIISLQVNVLESPQHITIKNKELITVDISIEELIEKEFEIDSAIDIIAKPYYYVAPPIFNPEKVTASGAESLINKVKSIKAIGEETNIYENTLKNYMLQAYDENNNIIQGITFSEKWVQGTIKVNEGKSVPINIITTGNLPENLRISSTHPSKSRVNITGPDNLIDSISSINTNPIDITSITKSTEEETTLVIPDGISVNRGEDLLTVKFNIEELQTKEISLGYIVKGIKTGFKIVPKSETVSIKIYAYEEDLKTITDDKIKIELDISNYSTPGTYKSKPTVTIEGVNLPKPIDILEEIQFDIVKSD